MTTLAYTPTAGKFVDSCGPHPVPADALEQASQRLRKDLPADAYWSVNHTTELMHFTDGAENRVERWECVIRCRGEHQQVGSGRTASDAIMDALSKRQGEQIAALKYRRQEEWDAEHEPERFQPH